MLTIYLRGNHTITVTDGAEHYAVLEQKMGSSGAYDLTRARGGKTRVLLQNVVAIGLDPPRRGRGTRTVKR